MPQSALTRIMRKDMKSIKTFDLNSMGIYIEFNENDLFQANAMIVGPKDSLYEGGFLFFTIRFPSNYPYSPPDIAYVSRNNVRIHPNIYVGRHTSGLGKICLSILGTWSGPKWTTIMDISTVLLSIQSLLDTNPFYHEPDMKNSPSLVNNNYNELIQYETIATLILKNITDIPHGFDIFKPHMIHELHTNYESLLSIIHEWDTKQICIIKIPFYRIIQKLEYQKIYKAFTDIIPLFIELNSLEHKFDI